MARRRHSACVAALVAILAAAACVADADDSCTLNKVYLATQAPALSACYKAAKVLGFEPDPSIDAQASEWLADSAAAAIRAEREFRAQRVAEGGGGGASGGSDTGASGAGAALAATRRLAAAKCGGRPARAQAPGAAPATLPPRPAERFNTLLGSTQIGKTYKFTDEPTPLEGARRMLAAGARAHKFRLATWFPAEKKGSGSGAGASAAGGDGDHGSHLKGGPIRSLVDAATRRELGYSQLLDLPFKRFVFWAYAVDQSTDASVFREFYDLAAHLIVTYAGTGKQFYIGHWEGDWAIRAGYKDPVVPERAAHFRRTLSAAQRAIDAAKADFADLVAGPAGAKVWGYAEVNRVLGTMRDASYVSFINQVVPYINPPVDYLSYSNWEIEEERERTPSELVDVLSAALSFIDCHVPPKPCVPGPRTFIGEYGYFLRAKNCSAMLAPQPTGGGGIAYVPTTPEIVAARSMWLCAAAVAWGSPLALFWEVYSNEPGLDPATGRACDRGYWLVDNEGHDAPVMGAHRAFFAAAERHIAEHSGGTGAAPRLDDFRRWAVDKLVELSGYGALGVAPPPVRPLGDIEAMAAGGGGDGGDGAW